MVSVTRGVIAEDRDQLRTLTLASSSLMPNTDCGIQLLTQTNNKATVTTTIRLRFG